MFYGSALDLIFEYVLLHFWFSSYCLLFPSISQGQDMKMSLYDFIWHIHTMDNVQSTLPLF